VFSGAGLGTVRVMETHEFCVTAQDGYGNVPLVRPALTATMGAATALPVVDVGNGTYIITYMPTELGVLSLNVYAGGQPAGGGAQSVSVVAGPVVMAAATDISAAVRTLPGYTGLLTVALLDVHGFPSPVLAGDVFTAAVTGLRAANATVLASQGETAVNVSVVGLAQGTYYLYVSRNAVEVPGGPFEFRLYGRSPRLIIYAAADPLDASVALSAGDTLTLVFDAATSRPPAGDTVAVNALLTFSHPIGRQYSGRWEVAATGGDQLVLTVTDPGVYSAPPIGQARVTVTGSSLQNTARDSRPTTDVSPVLAGNFGLTGCGTYGRIAGLCWWAYIIIGVVLGVAALTAAFVAACVVYSRRRNDESEKSVRARPACGQLCV
jgi:hypothetical protein